MRGCPRSFHSFLSIMVLFAVACGGGGGGGGIQPPPPQPDFTITVSSAAVDVSQGGASSPINVTVNAENGFASAVDVTFPGLPDGVATSPVAPLLITPGTAVSVSFDATSSAAAGQFAVTAQGTSGSLSHSSAFTLDVHQSVPVNLPRTTFVPNDSVASLDNPAGEPRHRRLVYDAASQRLYVANSAMNRVEVWNAATQSLVANIDAPGASSADLSLDAKTLWVGSTTQQILAIDTAALQVRARYPVSGLSPIPGVTFNRPTEVLALASGKLAVRLRQSANSESLLAIWDSSSNTYTNLTPLAPAVFQNGAGVLARSGDHTRLLAAANDSTGELAVFDANGNLLAGPNAPASGAIPFVSASSDGSHFAVVVAAGSVSQLLLLDSKLNVLSNYSASSPSGVVFSQDSQTLYLDESFGNSRVVSALSASDLHSLGQIADIPLQNVPTQLQEMCGNPLTCGLGNRGIAFLDASHPASLPHTAPLLSAVPVATPSEGPAIGGTSVTLSGQNFSPGAQLRFASSNPVSATLLGNSQLQAASPPSASAGQVNLTAYFTNGWLTLAPNAFSYGPSILRVFPSAGPSAGGDTITVLGYGFGSSTGDLSVTVGGQNTTLVNAEAFPQSVSSLGLDSSYPFPLERLIFKTPPGSPGKADVVVHSPSGSATAPKAFQYLSSIKTYPNGGLHKFIIYDSSRQKLFMTATDHVDVFDLNALSFLSPIYPPPNGPPPTAGLRGLALTPDHSQLLVADFGSQNVYVINPDGAAYNGTVVHVGGVAGFLNSGPMRVAATSAQTVFVSLYGNGGSAGACNNCLGQMNLLAYPPTYLPAPQPEVTSLTGAPLLQVNAAGDTAYLAYSNSPGGPVASWAASTPDAFSVSPSAITATDLTTSADGSLFAVRANNSTGIYSSGLTLMASPISAELESIPNRVAVPGIVLHPTGALLYEPFLDGPPPPPPPHAAIDIRDAHNGQLRLRVLLPEPFAMLSTDTDGLHGGFLAVDENGQRLFALTTSGLTIIKLANVPLGIGSLSPPAGSAAGGVVVTLRGSGFVNGTKITLGGKSANVTWKDMNTLTFATPAVSQGLQQLVLSNPDGETVSLDAAFLAQ